MIVDRKTKKLSLNQLAIAYADDLYTQTLKDRVKIAKFDFLQSLIRNNFTLKTTARFGNVSIIRNLIDNGYFIEDGIKPAEANTIIEGSQNLTHI